MLNLLAGSTFSIFLIKSLASAERNLGNVYSPYKYIYMKLPANIFL